MNSKQIQNRVQSAFVVMILLIASKTLGFFREVLIAKSFGTSSIVDAYTVAVALPSVIFTVFASGFSNSYIPSYSRVLNNERERFFNITITTLTSVAVIFSVLCFVFNYQIAEFFAPGFSGNDLILTADFIQIMSTIFPFMTLFNLLCCQSQVMDHFIFVSFCDYIVINIVVIASIYFAAAVGAKFLIYGYVSSMVVASIMMAIFVKKKLQVPYKIDFDIKNKSFIQLVRLAIPLGLSLAVNQLNSVVDKMFSSSLGIGVTSALSYADRVQLIPYSLTVAVVLTVCYPKISACFAGNDKKEASRYVSKACNIALYTGIPISVFLIVFRESIISLLFERGAFDSSSTYMTAKCLLCYAVGIPFYALREIASKVLAANMQQKVILKNSIITVCINIILNFVLVHYFSYCGLAIATSASGLISFILMMIELRNNGVKIIDKPIVIDSIKDILVTAITLVLALLMFGFFELKLTVHISLVFTLAISVILYVLLSVLFRISTATWLMIEIKNLVFRR